MSIKRYFSRLKRLIDGIIWSLINRLNLVNNDMYYSVLLKRSCELMFPPQREILLKDILLKIKACAVTLYITAMKIIVICSAFKRTL